MVVYGRVVEGERETDEKASTSSRLKIGLAVSEAEESAETETVLDGAKEIRDPSGDDTTDSYIW